MKLRRLSLYCLGVGLSFSAFTPALAASPSKNLITSEVLREIHGFIDQEIVRLSIAGQNERHNNFVEQDITRLDEQWVTERKSASQPLISATLSNPLSTYLTRVQAHSKGLYTEIFVMDRHGLNVGQSSISSDYWQGDEAKFQKTYPLGGDALFIDDPDYDDDLGTWNVQVNLSVADEKTNKTIGAATIQVNLTELQRRMDANVKSSQTENAPAPEEPKKPLPAAEDAAPVAEPTAQLN